MSAARLNINKCELASAYATIPRILIEFNQHASQVQGYGEGALQHHFYQGLPNRIKDEISCFRKPASLWDLQDLAQSVDMCYWECKSELSQQVKPTPSSSKSAKKAAEKPSFSKSVHSSTPAPLTSSGSKVPKD
jgi:hypothetical protein